MAWLFMLSLASAGSFEPLVEPAPTEQVRQAPLLVDAPVLRAEETPSSPQASDQDEPANKRLILVLVMAFAALAAVGGTVLCCCCFGIYGYYY